MLICLPPATVDASETHGNAVYHALHLEAGIGSSDDGKDVTDWDFDGWIGTDENKLWLKSEGERAGHETEQAEFWAMYSRNVATFWDFQIGLRHDSRPRSLTHLVAGFEGLAPYFFEAEVHVFLSEDDDVSARLRYEHDLLFTQRLIAQPYLEANFFMQDVPELGVGAGLADAEFGVQTRYEFTRGFAPYVEVKYERKFGETSSIAKRNGEDYEAVIGTLGLRFLF